MKVGFRYDQFVALAQVISVVSSSLATLLRYERLFATVDKFLESLFLRLYAKNLSRSFRSEPENACTDTEIQMTTMIGLFAGAFFLVIGAIFFPHYLRSVVNGGDRSVAVIVIVTVAIVYGVHKRFGKFQQTPELAQRYLSNQNRRWAHIVYWSFAIGWLLVAVFTLMPKHH